MQQAVQEKFRQANENLDELNKWLEKVERQIASQEIPIEDIDGLKNQINALKVRIIENLVYDSFVGNISNKCKPYLEIKWYCLEM